MSELNFTHSNGNKVKLTTPDTLAASKTFKLPGIDGSSRDILTTNGSGALSFSKPGLTLIEYCCPFPIVLLPPDVWYPKTST